MTEFLSRELVPYTVAAIAELLAILAICTITCGSIVVVLDEVVTSTLYPQKNEQEKQ